MAKHKRLDGIGHLTKEQKAERDARAQYWMNQRKIERVAEAAYRHGWYTFEGASVEWAINNGDGRLGENNELIIKTQFGEYRVIEYDFEKDEYLVRKIASYKEEEDGSNEEQL